MTRAVVLALCTAAIAAPVTGAATTTGFRAGTAVACALVKGTVRCDVRGALSPSPKGACASRWRGFTLGRATRPRPVCATTTVFTTALPAVPRGAVYAFPNGITCVALSRGVRCTNTSRHGFTLTPSTWSLR